MKSCLDSICSQSIFISSFMKEVLPDLMATTLLFQHFRNAILPLLTLYTVWDENICQLCCLSQHYFHFAIGSKTMIWLRVVFHSVLIVNQLLYIYLPTLKNIQCFWYRCLLTHIYLISQYQPEIENILNFEKCNLWSNL